ncbi:MAG: signal peptidase I, partial [Bacteroidales bacterium]|nr:signal peptidase I [Bacteroidales bacterium]
PADSYFLLGDNRDNALDSRYVGFVSKDCIQGRFLYIYASTSFQRINTDIRDK